MTQIATVSPDRVGDSKPTTTPRTTGYVWLLTAVACLGGLLFGYDTGIVSSTMLFLPDNNQLKPLSTMWQEVLISITPGMAGISAIVAGRSSDRFGRRVVILSASALFIVGTAVCSFAISRWMLLFGRVLLGIAIGFASMIVPVYIGEGSPLHVRGTLVTIYQLSIASGFVVANAIGAWFAHYNPEQFGWRIMFAFAAVPALTQFIAFLYLPETPRFLAKREDEKEARKVLSKIYNGDEEWIEFEMNEIIQYIKEEKRHKQIVGDKFAFVRVLQTPHVLKATLLGCSLQMFQQLTGINTIMYYTGTIVRSAGIKNKITNIWISCAISAVQVVGTFPPLKLIDRLGRRLLIISSSLTTIISLCLVGMSFFLIAADSEKLDLSHAYDGITFSGMAKNSTIHRCASLKSCDACVTAEACGFCSSSNKSLVSQCLPLDYEDRDHSLDGHCQYNTPEVNYTFADSYCVTKYTALPIALMVVYLMCYAFGFGPVPWVYNAEIYPLWARSTCVSLSTFTNWVFSLIISLTFLSLSQTITKGGAFFFYAGVSFIGLLVFYFFLPETRGCQIEEIEMLFMSKSARKQRIAEKNFDEKTGQHDDMYKE